jgi:putative membrane protein
MYFWTKTLHVLFVMAWMGPVFYLPRILVNLAEARDQPAVVERLALMGRRLYRFGHAMFGVMFLFGLAMWIGAIAEPARFPIPVAGWLHVKVTLVALMFAYFIASGVQLKRLAAGGVPKSPGWYRWYNELPLVLLVPVIYLVIAKPF